MSDLDIGLTDLKADWSLTSQDVCAHCGKKIDPDELDEEGQYQIPLLLWKQVDGKTYELAFTSRAGRSGQPSRKGVWRNEG